MASKDAISPLMFKFSAKLLSAEGYLETAPGFVANMQPEVPDLDSDSSKAILEAF